jgi:site-specific DNA recombinase
METRAALYLRVSTARQAEKDLSIPDQRRQAEAYCKAKGWAVAQEFEERGASATDDKRPVFQEMVDTAARRASVRRGRGA